MFLSNLTIIELMLCYSWVGVLTFCSFCFPSLLGNVSLPYWEKFCPFTLGIVSHPYWETFPIPTGKCFASLLRNVSHPYWERFPISPGKGFPSWLGNISHTVGSLFHPYSWETFTLSNGKYFLILLGNGSYFHCLTSNMAILSIFCNSRQTAWILQRINSSRNGSKRETFPGWLSTNYEKYSPLWLIFTSLAVGSLLPLQGQSQHFVQIDLN